MMKNRFLYLIFSGCFWVASAQAADLCGTVQQGEIVIGKVLPKQEVLFNGKKLPVTADGRFLLAFGRDETNTQELLVQDTQSMGGGTSYTFAVAPKKWDIQNITGVPPRKVTPSDADMDAIQLEGKVVGAALKGVDDSTAWTSGFILPVEGRISGKFGGQRIMNKIPKSPHRGMDIAAKEGTPIKAAADGKIVLAYPDLFYSGNTVIIDHGFGLQTIYAHMKEMNVKRGDVVKQGDIIGSVGKTGRVTGPHLHWGASLRDVRFNPQSLLDINKKQQKCFTL